MANLSVLSMLKIPSEINFKRPRTLQQNLIDSYNRRIFVDAEIRIQSRIFQVHKCILAFYSPIFQKAFYGTQVQSPLCELNHINSLGFETLLRFIYCSDITVLQETFLVEACETAGMLEMTGIKEKLINYIFYKHKANRKPIIEEQFWLFLQKSHSLKVSELEEKLLRFAEKNTKYVLSHQQFCKTESHIIKLVLNLKTLAISDKEILESIVQWKDSNSNFELLKESVQDLLMCVNFERLSPREFYNIVSNHEDLISGKDALDILMHLVDPTASSLPEWCSIGDKCCPVAWNMCLNTNFTDEVNVDYFKSPDDLQKVNKLKYTSDWRSKSRENLKTLAEPKSLKNWRNRKPDVEESTFYVFFPDYAKAGRKDKPNATSLLPESFSLMLKEDLFTDIILCDRNGTKIPAHRLILALGSEFFASMLYRPTPTRILHLEENAQEIKIMLKYFYETGETFFFKRINSSLETILKKFDMALKYKCDILMKMYRNVLNSTYMNPSTFWKLLNQQNQLENFKIDTKRLMKYALGSPTRVLNNENFYSATKSSLIKILENDFINISEFDILNYVACWLEKNSRDFPTDISRKELLKYIRFEALNVEQFFAFLKPYDKLLPKEDAFAILTVLFQNSKEHCLPEWCYCGPLRSLFYDTSAKIGTDVRMPWSSKPAKGRKSFMITYTATLSSSLVESQIQYLELSWKVKPNKKGKHQKHKCDVSVSCDGYETRIFKDVDVPKIQRIIVPFFVTLNTPKTKIQFTIEINTKDCRIYYFTSQKKLTFENVVFEASSSIFCISDAIVDNCTSEKFYIPNNLVPQNHDTAIPTEKCFKSVVEREPSRNLQK